MQIGLKYRAPSRPSFNDRTLMLQTNFHSRCSDSVCRLEPSTDQVSQAIYTQSLTKWVGAIPQDILKKLPEVSPMLGILGYDPWNNKPDYSSINFDSEYDSDSSDQMAVL